MILESKIILIIGMPGCGKSTIGKKVAEKLKFLFIDLDNYIEENFGETIKEMFNKGEKYFRELETKGIEELAGIQTPFVLSTGGGVVCNPYNMEILKDKCCVIFIDRPISDIAQDIDFKSRPLLSSGIQDLYELYRTRYPQYKRYSDFIIINNCSINNAVDDIINVLISS